MAVTHIGNPGADDTQLNALTQTVTALQATVDAQTARLTGAVTSAGTPPTPPATP